MEFLYSDILLKMRKKIIDDLDVYNGIINPLVVGKVLREEHIQRIERAKTKERRAEILLDILPSCGSDAFKIFHKALKRHYDWLSDDIDTMLRSSKLEMAVMRHSENPPNLPPQSSLNVNRDAKMQELRTALENLKPGGYLALHGMKGFGRSSLTASTLKDPELVKTLFGNKVYWIKFGYERHIDDEILIQLNFLYHEIKNADSLSTNLVTEPLKDQLIHSLKSHFVSVKNRNALLILDDVWNKEIIDAFDFPCKTLVITTDCDYLEGKHREIIKMKDGFTESETLGLFANMLGVDVKQLPPEAKHIHEECNGMPILIAMFAAHFEEFKDDMQVSKHRWQYYLNSLRTKDPTNRVIEQFLAKQEVIFAMCIDRLRPQIRQNYEMLAIFSEDVNIKPETLAILWESEKFVVEEQMIDLCHKSLAVKRWIPDLKSYVYGIHDLLLCHLRKKLGTESLRDLHRLFVEKYRKYCNDDFSKLPDDNYSFSYIGHHLEQASLYQEFPRLFLNFDFLREKIYRTGLSDLLIDLKKYRQSIVQGNLEVEEKIADLEKFLENRAGTIADQKRRKCLDLIQIGMNYTIRKFVREKSRELASLQNSKLFVTHDGPVFTLSSGNDIPTEARIALFADNQDRILIGNDSGRVILWDCQLRTQNIFSDHVENSPIKKIIISRNDDYFLTLNEEGHIKHYYLSEEEQSRRALSPRDKQQHWNNLFGIKTSKVQKHFILEGETITDMTLSQKKERTDRIAACTSNGTIKVWTIDEKLPFMTKNKGHSFVRTAFTREGSVLHAMDDQGALISYVETIDSPVLNYLYNSTWNPKLRDVIFFQAVPSAERCLIIVTKTSAVLVKWEELNTNNGTVVEQLCSFAKKRIAEVDSYDTCFTSAALTYDGLYLIISDSKGSVVVYNSGFIGGFEPIATFNGHVTSVDTYWLDEKFHLICGCGKNVIYRWELALENLPKSVRKPLFDAVMTPWGEENIVAKETQTTLVKEMNMSVNAIAINLYHGEILKAKTEPLEGSIIRLSLNSTGDKILYATDKHQIMVFNVETGATSVIKLEAPPTVVNFLTVGESTFVVCGQEENLMVCYGKIRAFVETGHVISIFTIGNEHVVTVARNGAVKFWLIRETNWSFVSGYSVCSKNENLCYSSLSSKENLLALLKGSNEMVIYEISKIEEGTTFALEMEDYERFSFTEKLSCCEFSKDNRYLAVGLETGEISVFDINGRSELSRLDLHCNEVRELHWAPESSGVPILLSVNCDELAWWNVALLAEEAKKSRRSRMGISRSVTGLDIYSRMGPKMTTSVSMDSSAMGVSKQFEDLTIERTNGHMSDQPKNGHSKNEFSNFHDFWKNKQAKYPNRKALLSVVPLPSGCNSKVCVSEDFTKFLSVDMYGVVSNFQFYHYQP